VGFGLESIAWVAVTHFHMDHAGLVSELVERGVQCIAFENQRAAIDPMERTIRKNDKSYRLIDQSKLTLLNSAKSKGFFNQLGLNAEAVPIDYHSPDSMVYVLPDAEMVIGDLPPEGHMMPEDRRLAEAWQKIRDLGGKRIFPSHAPLFELESR
jgi:endoribonuclease LACTB2